MPNDAVYLRELDAGTDNACWVVCNRVDSEAVAFIPKRSVTDEMVARALAGFDVGTGDPNDYKQRMRLALEAALSTPNK